MNSDIANRIEAFLSRQTISRSVQTGLGYGIGSLRGPREHNEDRAVLAQIALPSGHVFHIALICDGMGGMMAGGNAASCAAGWFLAGLISARPQPIRRIISDAIDGANRAVFSRYGGQGGTTLTAVMSTLSDQVWIAHVGDSRAYVRDEARLFVATRDDTIGGQLRSNSDEDVLDHRLLQFVGIGNTLEPHIFPIEASAGSTFFITSDGAHSIGKRNLETVTKYNRDAHTIVRKVMNVADALNVEDNASIVAIQFDGIETDGKSTDGAEITLWTAIDKVEIWISQHSIGSMDEPLPRPKQTERKTPKRRPKSPLRTRKKDETKIVESEKPQLNISFGSKEEPADD